ncbi:hypothetical protein APY03_2132 [Variovorax sp. WDL1]|nr:hypothetical protein APY03_2132 [Variovorax sp. WDL1]
MHLPLRRAQLLMRYVFAGLEALRKAHRAAPSSSRRGGDWPCCLATSKTRI